MKRVIDCVLLGFLPVALWAALPQTSLGQLNKGIKVNLNNVRNTGSLTIGIYLAGGSVTDATQAQQPVAVQQRTQGGVQQGQGKGKGKGNQGGTQTVKGNHSGDGQQARGGREQKQGGQTSNSLSQAAQMIGLHHHHHHHHHHFAHHHHEGMGHEGHSAGMTGHHHHHQQHAMNDNANDLSGKSGQSNLLTGGGKGNQAATLMGGGKGNQSVLQTGGKGNQSALQIGGKGNQTALQTGGKSGQSSSRAATRTPLSQFQSPITGTRIAANTRASVQSPLANPGTSKGKKK